MEQQLYLHNKVAYDKVMAAFKTSQRTCICHPTGTGKSYIVAAVCQHFNRVLILAPNIFVLKQQEEVLKWHSSVTYMTYAWLMLNYCNIQHKYDLIVLDEFHRVGADEWGAAVNLLLESQSQAKVLGTSATPIRYLDNERDMAQELFNNNIASTLTIAEAWSQNILPIPHYVRGLFQWDETISEAKRRINYNPIFDDEEKHRRLSRLNNKQLEWELCFGMSTILSKHIDKKAKRVIIFCAHVESLNVLQQEVIKWFHNAGFAIASINTMHSNLSEKEQQKQMKQFTNNSRKGLKLMFSINMLNEGIHIPRVDAVMMLRTTSSHIIYTQQMGRCLTAANTKNPVILDLVDNITTTTAIKEIREEFEKQEKIQAEKKKRVPRIFEVIDYTLDVKNLIEKLAPHRSKRIITFEEHLKIVMEFCRANGHLPIKGGNEATASWAWLRKHYGDTPDVKSLKEQYSKLNNIDNFKKIYIDYILQNHKLPVPGSKDFEERRIGMKWSHFRNQLINDPEIQKLRNQYSVKQRKLTESIECVKKFCEEHDRTPLLADGAIFKEWRKLVFGEHKEDSRILELRETYQKITRRRGDKDAQKRLKPIFDFLKKKRRLPCTKNSEERRMYYQLYGLQHRGAKNPTEKKLLDLVKNLRQKSR